LSIFLSRLSYTKIAFMLLEAKLLLDEVATEVMQDMGSLSGGYGRIWEVMGGYGKDADGS
jgi:hypothetical protein